MVLLREYLRVLPGLDRHDVITLLLTTGDCHGTTEKQLLQAQHVTVLLGR